MSYFFPLACWTLARFLESRQRLSIKQQAGQILISTFKNILPHRRQGFFEYQKYFITFIHSTFHCLATNEAARMTISGFPVAIYAVAIAAVTAVDDAAAASSTAVEYDTD